MMSPMFPSNPIYGIFIPPIPPILDFFQVFCRHFVDEEEAFTNWQPLFQPAELIKVPLATSEVF